MTQSNQTIQKMFDALQNRFGAFREAAQEAARHPGGLFEDVPASVLNTEHADEARFEDLPRIVQQAAAQSTALLAA